MHLTIHTFDHQWSRVKLFFGIMSSLYLKQHFCFINDKKIVCHRKPLEIVQVVRLLNVSRANKNMNVKEDYFVLKGMVVQKPQLHNLECNNGFLYLLLFKTTHSFTEM